MTQCNSRIYQLQREMAKLPQVELDTRHYFADGVYARELFRPAGTLIVGKVHKKRHLYLVAHGTVRITHGDGQVEDVEGPTMIVSEPGAKRAVWALTDATCYTFHGTHETDLDKIEAETVEPDDTALYDARNKLKQIGGPD